MKKLSILFVVLIMGFASCKKETSTEPAQSLVDTTWDFTIIFSPTVSWHADVSFYEDGVAVYDEADYPGQYTSYGEWSLDGNILTYDMMALSSGKNYLFTGTLSGNKMSGTYIFAEEVKNWTAVLK